MTVNLKALNAKHKQLIRMHVQGLDIGRIERHLGFCAGYGSKILNTPLVQAKIKEMQEGLDDSAVENVNDARAVIAGNASLIAENLVHLSLHATKEETQGSVGIQTLKFAESGKVGDTGPKASVNIFMRGENGALEQVDIFASAYDGDDSSEEEGEEQSALEIMEGDFEDEDDKTEEAY